MKNRPLDRKPRRLEMEVQLFRRGRRAMNHFGEINFVSRKTIKHGQGDFFVKKAVINDDGEDRGFFLDDVDNSDLSIGEGVSSFLLFDSGWNSALDIIDRL